ALHVADDLLILFRRSRNLGGDIPLAEVVVPVGDLDAVIAHLFGVAGSSIRVVAEGLIDDLALDGPDVHLARDEVWIRNPLIGSAERTETGEPVALMAKGSRAVRTPETVDHAGVPATISTVVRTCAGASIVTVSVAVNVLPPATTVRSTVSVPATVGFRVAVR